MFLFRQLAQASYRFSHLVHRYSQPSLIQNLVGKSHFSVSQINPIQPLAVKFNSSILPSFPSLGLNSLPSSNLQQTRSVTKWSLKKGKRKTVKAVIHRFYRLGWDAWIRPMVGRNKRHWSKNRKRKIQAEKHVFCNSTQSTLLDKMVTRYWRKRRFYVDDIYEPYHQREEFRSSAVKPH
uniref:Large ribosomal subunit protein bL35m n=1 Tax=Scapholeberis mucronata TaxID=202097 RepID=A0A4Y7NLD1_9CRUS|nr:EOG090X0J5E [Scapholeberis mucronata]SVE94002.1 EOG090X0J5E [Scapholeberis mucronata]